MAAPRERQGAAATVWSWLDTGQRYLLLSLLATAACLPVVTAPAAVAAVQDVAARRAAGEDSSVVRGFIRSLRGHLRPGTLAGTVLVVVAAVLVVDLLVVGRMEGLQRRVLTTVLLAVTLPVLIAAAQLPAVLRSGGLPVPRAVLRVVVLDPAGSALRVLLLAAFGVLLVSAPPLGVVLLAPWARLVVALERPLSRPSPRTT